MKEIKSVRVRKTNVKSGTLDIKVTLYEDRRTFGVDNRVLVGLNNDRPVWTETTYRMSGIYKDFTDKQFIDDFIKMNSKIDGGGNEYVIIQDPWEDKVPIIRNYGFDPYYLNNGAEVYISWTNTESGLVEGGKKYSKPDGTEITYDPTYYNETGNVRLLSITKSIRIVHKEETQNLTINKSDEFEYTIYSNDYRGTDLIILDILISKWKSKIPNYDLELCSPNNESCSVIPYKSPLKPLEPELVTSSVASNETPKEPIIVVLPESIKVKVDTTFKIFIGKNKELDINQNILKDDELTDLSDEYTEESFAGVEEDDLQLYHSSDEASESSHDPTSDIASSELDRTPYTPGKYKLDIIPGTYVTNAGDKITLCQIDGRGINVKIADAFLDMRDAAKKDGITLSINSGFRSPYDNINTKSTNGVKVSASSQQSLYNAYLSGRGNLAAKPGKSNHGNGISLDIQTGSRAKGNLNTSVYKWLVKNSWKFGFLRGVANEEWHYDYLPKISSGGPYAKLGNKGNSNLFFSDLGLDRLA